MLIRYTFDQETTIADHLAKFGLDNANAMQVAVGGEEPSEDDGLQTLPSISQPAMMPSMLTVVDYQFLVPI